jgi:hypothetical protein
MSRPHAKAMLYMSKSPQVQSEPEFCVATKDHWHTVTVCASSVGIETAGRLKARAAGFVTDVMRLGQLVSLPRVHLLENLNTGYILGFKNRRKNGERFSRTTGSAGGVWGQQPR